MQKERSAIAPVPFAEKVSVREAAAAASPSAPLR
jgi:hypothetical protein